MLPCHWPEMLGTDSQNEFHERIFMCQQLKIIVSLLSRNRLIKVRNAHYLPEHIFLPP